jgi:hypothetical protein
MPWWGWIVLGVVLLGAEVAISTEFYIVFFGVSAVLVGVVLLAGADLPVWVQWLFFAVVAVVCLVFYRQRLRDRFSRPDRPLDEQVVGLTAVARGIIAPGSTGSAELRGTVWQARNIGDRDLADGERCRVAEVDGITLRLRPGAETSN